MPALYGLFPKGHRQGKPVSDPIDDQTEMGDEERRALVAKGYYRRYRARFSGQSQPTNRRLQKSSFSAVERAAKGASQTSSEENHESDNQTVSEAKNTQSGWVSPPGIYRSKTGPRPSRWDPQPIGKIIREESKRRNWSHPLSMGTVTAHWDKIVGPQIALHCPIETFEQGVLIARADSSAWAQQLRLLLPQIQKRIAEEVGEGVVQQVVVKPPKAPTWSHGSRRVPGRGPRDTYG